MPIDVERVVGSELPATAFTWDEDDVLLYNLAVGAGDPPNDPGELQYAYEGDLAALPTYATIPPFGALMGLIGIEGVDVDLSQILHGDQRVEIHRPLPTSGTVTQEGEVVAVYDRGKGALAVVEVVSSLEGDDEPLFTNRAGIFIRGEGGFGGDPGPRTGEPPPDRSPDHEIETETLPQQALLYRLASGDRNPLHADPGFAAMAGFDRPILHGLCTYGIVAKAVIGAALGGDPSRLASYSARFSGHVFPGETLITRVWSEGSRHLVEAATQYRGTKVLSNAVVESR